MKPTATKTFDCVESKRKAQARITRRIAGLSPEAEIASYAAAVCSGPLGAFWRKLEEAAEPASDGQRRERHP